ncbi:hypothetical protein [Nonomuraea indica]|uniref:Uncharacterized protein n=1 Tax=Nonomuraea indica TaxID=1581193 RepID=A0ABW8A8C8_9ACTN|nr:hypothetical protein [Nonomuraea indica]
MPDERHPIRRPPGTRPVASMTGPDPGGRRVAVVNTHPRTHRPSGPQPVADFATPMTGFHVRRVFDERCPGA